MTIGQLVRGKPTETQYEVFQRADRRFADGGRFYGGPLTDEDVRVLTDDLEAFGTKKKRDRA